MALFHGTRKWLHVMAVDGRFRRLRRLAAVVLHLILFIPPWISMKGNPLLRFDLEERRLYAFGAIFTGSDTILLLLILLFLAFSLFFFTSLFGRLWCGYACPQTVFLEEWIRPLERWIEGPRGRWIHRDDGPVTLDRGARKAAKWAVFGVAAFIVSMAFMSYFAGARELWTGRAGPVEYTLVGIFTLAWFLDFAWFREQFCNYLCPYARFQSAMTDEQTLLITYDITRGEPRGVPTARDTGACIACQKCVAVCPQGIDIRDGFQLECIACGACMDACDDVLGRLGHPGLIDYTSMAQGQHRKTRRLRPRTLIYATLLSGIAAAWITLLVTRVPFEANVNRAPGSLFTMDADGFVRNTYLLELTNNAPGDSISFHVAVEGVPGAEVVAQDIRLAESERRTVPLVVRLPSSRTMARTIPIRVRVQTPGAVRILQTTFKTGGTLAAVAAQ
jgi:cytochrome c oxidase accessory protein FixG